METSYNYDDFLNQKRQLGTFDGFSPVFLPSFLYDFQDSLVEWAIKKGKAAIFADCGLGKTPIQLVWAENIVRKTNKKVLILTPLAVSHQTIREGTKFGIECLRSDNGKPVGKITVTNYERLHLFDPNDYIGIVADESSILKNFDGTRKKLITEFMKKYPYRLLCTATAAPNDYIELGTSSEALGELGYMDMLNRFFKNDNNTCAVNRFYGSLAKWRFKNHAKKPFWQWVSGWARAIRKPSDMGFNDRNFTLPPLIERKNLVKDIKPLSRGFFPGPSIGLKEQRDELKRTLVDRCEKAAELVNNDKIALVWCNLNAEGDLLEDIIPGSVQVSGSDSDDKKERILNLFSDGNIRVLITKPRIGGFGLNWQHCSHMVFFPSHSYEQYYQGVRRCWRFGQIEPVTVDIVTTDGDNQIMESLQRKSKAAEDMFTDLIRYMNTSIQLTHKEFNKAMETPEWL